MMELKEKAVLNCSEAELGIALVPVIAPGVNVYAGWRYPEVCDGSYAICKRSTFPADQLFWQMSQQRPQAPITIPKMLKLIEEQTDGFMKSEDFAGVEQRIHTVFSCSI